MCINSDCSKMQLISLKFGLAACSYLLSLSIVLGGSGVAAYNNGAALTPPMGWSSWNTFACNVSESLIKGVADTMVANGMRDAGYVYVNIDDCWMRCSNRSDDTCHSPEDGRDESGRLVPDPARFPSGMKALADYIHSLGMKFGMYSSSGKTTCSSFAGSWQNEAVDAETFASWGVDFLKLDCCSSTKAMKDIAYPAMSDALNKTNRVIVYSCDTDELFANPLLALESGERPYAWGPSKCNMIRTSGDIKDDWFRVLLNLDLNDHWWDLTDMAAYAGPGTWNDPDMLVVGMGKLSKAQYRSHFFLWAIMAAPLVAGNDVRAMDAETLELLTSPEVIAVDQDSLGVQGRRLRFGPVDGHEVWYKPLADGSRAVVFFNRSLFDGARICVSYADIGLPSEAECAVRDLHARKDLGTARGSFCGSGIASRDSMIVRIAC